MNQQEIEAIVDAQADLQVAIGWHRLEIYTYDPGIIERRMYDCLNRLHDVLNDNGKVMGRHMEAALCKRCGGRKSITVPAYDDPYFTTITCPECVAPAAPEPVPENLGLPETRGGWLSR